MKALKTFALLLFVALFAFACGDDGDDNPADGGGDNNGSTSGASSKGSLSTHSGNNTVVTSDNAAQVSNIITTKSHEVFGRALQTAAPKTVAGITQNLNGKVNGNKSGYAQVTGTVVVNYNGTSVGSTTYNFTCTYNDFSDDGALWFGGQVVYTGTMTMNTATSYSYNLKFNGGMKFNGTYEGSQDFVTTYTMNGTSFSYNSDTTITSGGQTFKYSYKYPQ